MISVIAEFQSGNAPVHDDPEDPESPIVLGFGADFRVTDGTLIDVSSIPGVHLPLTVKPKQINQAVRQAISDEIEALWGVTGSVAQRGWSIDPNDILLSGQFLHD